MSAHKHGAPSISGLGQNGAHWEMQSFDPPLGHRRMVLGPEALPSQDKSSQPVPGLFPCVGLSFHCKLSVCSFVLLKHVCHVAPGNPTAVLRSPPIQSPYRLLCNKQAGAQDGCVHANGPEGAAERNPWPWGLTPTTEVSVCLFPMWGKLVPPMLDCGVFSLATLISTHSGQNCWDLGSWGQATDVSCSKDPIHLFYIQSGSSWISAPGNKISVVISKVVFCFQ